MKFNLSTLLASGKYFFFAQHRYLSVSTLVFMLAFSMFTVGRATAPAPDSVKKTIAKLKAEISEQQQELDSLARDHQANINGLAARLAELKAGSTRLDALGERLVKLGQLDPAEFDFDQPPPMGGPEHLVKNSQTDVIDVSEAVSQLSTTFQHQLARLDALQLLMLDRNLEEERTPSGWPVKSGWISSGFGERNDPFTGKLTKHDGLDFAGKKGSDVLSVARGVVIWASTRHSYGKTVEIDHGNGYVTRYAHGDELLVNVGDRVTAGQKIAKMGQTGRATSPHVHFEVLKKGRAINPRKYVAQNR